MRKFLPLLAVFALGGAPAVAQTAPSQQSPAEKPKTVTKVVCERVSVEEETGSRLGAAPKVCRKVEVPADSAGKKPHGTHAPSHSGHAH